MLSESRSIIKIANQLLEEAEDSLNYKDNIEDYEFDPDIITYRGKRQFPDMILKSNATQPGAMIEVKNGKGSSISSFNSTYPTGSKSITDLEELTGQTKRTIRKNLESAEDDPSFDEERDVYYLVRTYRESETTSPIISLVYGDYFGKSESSAIAECFRQILKDIESEEAGKHEDLIETIEDKPYVRHAFSQTRKESRGIKVRFRIMYEVEQDLNPNEQPEIPENSVNFITSPDECDSFNHFQSLLDPSDLTFKQINHQHSSRNEKYYVATRPLNP